MSVLWGSVVWATGSLSPDEAVLDCWPTVIRNANHTNHIYPLSLFFSHSRSHYFSPYFPFTHFLIQRFSLEHAHVCNKIMLKAFQNRNNSWAIVNEWIISRLILEGLLHLCLCFCPGYCWVCLVVFTSVFVWNPVLLGLFLFFFPLPEKKEEERNQ